MKTFYFRFRPVAVVLKIFGVFPIQNVTSLDTSDLRFQFFSFSNFYSLIIFCLYGAMIYYFSFLLYYIPTRQPYLLFVVCLMIARSIVSFLFCYSKYRKLPKLIRLLDTFDQKKCGILTPSTRKNMVVWSITSNLIAMIGLLFSSYQSFELISTILPPGVDKSKIGLIASSFFTFLTTWQLYPSFLYIYFSIIIKFNFKEINKTLKHRNFTHDYFKSGVKKYDSDMHQMLSNIRYFHNMLSECVDELGKCYGTYIATDNFCMIIIFVFNISVYLYKSNRDTHLLMLTVGYAIILLNMILRSEDLKESVSKKCIP